MQESNNIFDDIFNSLSKISKVQNLCIINKLNEKQKKRISIKDAFQNNEKVIVFDDTPFNECSEEEDSKNESVWILVDSEDKEIAVCDTKSIIHLVLGGDIGEIFIYLFI